MEFVPAGFLQMIYVDRTNFDKQNYRFDYVRREFLGEVRCLVFDVTPLPKSGKGRFTGRIWVEDEEFHIVRFNGSYAGSSATNYYFHFDSWRVNAAPNQWLPAFIYSEESNFHYALTRRITFKAQTRLWGYGLGRAKQEQELSRILVEAPRQLRIRLQPQTTCHRCRRNACGTAKLKITFWTEWRSLGSCPPAGASIKFSKRS